MDSYHRKPQENDSRTGRDCQFCLQMDPEFAKRVPIDRWVQGKLEDSASSHLSENGYVRHRIFEIAARRSQRPMELSKSA